MRGATEIQLNFLSIATIIEDTIHWSMIWLTLMNDKAVPSIDQVNNNELKLRVSQLNLSYLVN
jgi:hypothetical protein